MINDINSEEHIDVTRKVARNLYGLTNSIKCSVVQYQVRIQEGAHPARSPAKIGKNMIFFCIQS